VPRRQPTPPERSPEERARAAAERAARRGETAPPPETFLARNAQPPEPAPSDEDPFRVERASPSPQPADGSWFEQTAPPQATQEFQPEWLEEDDAVEWELPEPVTPKTTTKTRSGRPPRGPRRPVYAGNGRAPRPSRWGRRVLAVLALGLIGGALWLINATFQPFHDEPTGAVAVTVPPGVDAGEIGTLLQDAGVIDNARLFEANATVTLRRAKLRPGKYTLPKGMSNGAAIEALMQGPKAKVVKTFKFTLPEGRSIRENVPAVDKGPFDGSYAKAAKSASAVKRAHTLGLPRASKNLEGFLFPATYEMISGASAGDLVKRQLDAYEQNVKSVPMKTARRRNLTRYDVLIIASMVEREAQLKRERPLIAAVIHNRLREGTPLGIDATIRYDINNWARPLRVSELERDTPYNTRTRRGLPPTPIGNPGVDSIKAAANPANVKYLFFVRKPGKSGEHAFSRTNAQFERDVARYQASRGGP
jgi:uncharacterized YceG family protein